MQPTNDYLKLAARFNVVRRAWKRAAALSGLAVVVTEGIGIFTAMLFLDWLYQPEPLIRVLMWAAALAGIGYFVARHVVKPLLRKIPDEQIALYIEERRSELDGVLITAAEFGRKRDRLTGKEGGLIDAVVNEAVTRSARTQVGRVADFSRLRKYGLVAVAGMAGYLVLAVLFPATFGHHIGRLLEPWSATSEDEARHAAEVAKAEPLRFKLSKGDTSLARGTSFDFEATLSKPKPANEAVTVNFRPKGGGDWQKLAMPEIEKINGFQGVLADVSEDLEFYVSCGNDKSDTYHLTVFDPLVVQSLETTTHYPDYVKQPDAVERPSTGDVTALVGSKVTLRILTSTPLKDGLIKWSDGQTQSVTVDAQANATATVSFEIKKDDTYDYTLTDVNGQQAVSAAPLSVHAIPDTPPTIALKSPQSPVITQPLGEINFDAVAGDDFGVEGIDLVYSRADTKGDMKETRVPMKYHATVATGVDHAVAASYRLALEDANPPFQTNDAVSFHLEARDAKGQVTSTPIGLIIVGYFSHWATWAGPGNAHGIANHTNADLMAILALVWELNNEKADIKPDDLQRRSAEIAGHIVDPAGKLVDFLNLPKYPQLARNANLINTHIMKGHDALMTTDTGAASNELSTAVALIAGNIIMLDTGLHTTDGTETIVGSQFLVPKVWMLEKQRLFALHGAKPPDEAQAEDAAGTAQKVDDILKQQDALVAHARALVQAQNTNHGNAAIDPREKMQQFGVLPTGGPNPNGQQQPQPPMTAAELAAQQDALAKQARGTAATAKAQAAAANNANLKQAADQTAAAARTMEEAARDFAAGKNGEGQDKADLAKTALQQASNTLQNNDRDKLAAAIDAAEGRAAVLLDKQKELAAQTDALSKDLGNNAPDQRQRRDLQKQAYQQGQLGAEAEALKNDVGHLNEWAQQVGQHDAVRAMSDAQHLVTQGEPQAKLAQAVDDLNNANPSAAGGEQKNAIDTLQKLADSLQTGSDALAASRAAQLNRANRIAQNARKNLDDLMGKNQGQNQAGAQGKADQAQAGAQGKADQAQAGAQGKADQAQAGAQGKADQAQAGAQGKADQAQAGAQGNADQAKAGAQGKPDQGPAGAQGQQQGTQAGTQAGAQTQASEQTASNSGNGGGSPDEARKLAYNLTQLVSVIDNRQLIPQDQVDQLKEMGMDKSELEKRLMVDPKFLQDVSTVVGNISDKIEAALEAKTEAGRLFSSQREECPPNYRQFVNKYFEALSQTAPPPDQGSQPAPSAGQP